MWVTQTYLGKVELDAKLFVYYCYEDYDKEQIRLTAAIQTHLENLGEVYRDKVSLMMPNPRYAASIEGEVRQHRVLWEAIQSHLPGLLLSPAPLDQLSDSHKGYTFVPLQSGDPEHLANIIRDVRQKADEAVAADLAKRERPGWARRLANAIELKPGIWGIRIDVRRLIG